MSSSSDLSPDTARQDGFAPGATGSEQVLFARTGQAGRVLLNRPRTINALTAEMVRALTQQLDEWEVDDEVTAVTLQGAGEKGFCAGGDVVAVRRAMLEGGDPLEFWSQEYDLDHRISTYPKPVVALLDGIVMGGGVGLGCYASLRVATQRTRLAMPETTIGYFPDVGARLLLARAPGELGTHLALTSATMTGADAVATGFADVLIEADRWESLVSLLSDGATLDSSVGEHEVPSTLLAQRDWIDQAYAGDDPVAIVARLREAGRRGNAQADVAADAIGSRSPLAVAVTLEAVRRAGRADDLRAVLDEDLVIDAHMVTERADFAEGVRALLVDKDRAPRWRHAALAEVSRGEVSAFFDV